MQITIDGRAFEVEKRFAAQFIQSMTDGAKLRVRAVSLNTERRIKIAMPVDTGRARASWGHFTPADIARQEPGNAPSAGDAIWREADGGLTLEQGTNVEYVAGLNEGHSTQAPAGFIDAAAERGQQELEAEISLMVEQVARG